MKPSALGDEVRAAIEQVRATEDRRQRSLDQDRESKEQTCRSAHVCRRSPRMYRPPSEELRDSFDMRRRGNERIHAG